MNEKSTKNLVYRLNRAEGQIRGIKAMIEKGAYCDDVLTQVSAVQSALNSVAKLVLESHIKTCVATGIKNDDEDIVDEFIKTVGRLVK